MPTISQEPQVRHPPCRTRPPEWWDVDNDGARLAILLCNRACPRRPECHTDVPADRKGTVRAGVPYDDRGGRMAACHCGYPTTKPEACCRWCAVPNVSIMSRREYQRQWARRRTWRESKQKARAA